MKLKTLIVVNDKKDADLILSTLETAGIFLKSKKVVFSLPIEDTIIDEKWDVVLVNGVCSQIDISKLRDDLNQWGLPTLLILVADNITDEQKTRYLALGVNECLQKTDLNQLGVIVKREVKYQRIREKWWKKKAKEKRKQEKSKGNTQKNLQQGVQKEALIREVFDSTVEGFLILNLNGRILEANDAYSAMTGYTSEELKQLSVRDIDVEDDAALVILRIQRTVSAGSERFETRHRRKNGSIFNVEISATYLSEGEGRIICFCRDITDRKATEKELEQRLARLIRPSDSGTEIKFDDLFDIKAIQQMQDKFADATGVASIITKPDGTPITNPSNFCRLCKDIIRGTELGRANCYRSDAEIGKLDLNGPIIQECMSGGLWDAGAGISVGGQHIANWLIGQVRDETQSEDRIRAYARKIGADEEEAAAAFYEVKSMSGEQFERVSQALYIIANQLSMIAYQNLQQARFIEKQQKVEQALIESENRYKVFFDHGPDAVALVDPETGNFVEFNENTHRFLGYTREEFKNFRIFDLDADKAPEQIQYETQLITDHGHAEFEARLRTKQGEIRNFFVIVEVVYAGVTPFHLSLFRDITKRKQTEEKIVEYQEHLEDLVERRTAELTVINNELEAFSYSVSHDLRAPLRTINGFSKMLNDDYATLLDDTAKHYLGRIQSASARMGQLIEDLLNLSRITRREIQFMEVNLSHLAKRISREMLDQTPGRTINVEIAPDIVVWADYNLMKIALENLLFNAHKFTANQEIARVVFGVKEENGQVVYYVEDNGAGFDMDYAEKLFMPFQRLHSADEYTGTGIGLSIVKRIIARHNGLIWAEAAVGKGATFYFTMATKK